jgi:general secretion pathway protein A
MFLEYYHLREQPFGVTPDPRFLYFGPAHREALASLMYSIETRRGFSAMVAEPGMGKTTLLFRLLETLRASTRTAFLFQTEGDSRDLLRGVLADLGISTQSHDLAILHETLNAALLEEMRVGRQVVVVLDEAQNLDEKSLESVRLLSNFETSTQKLMHIVLAGQPKLGQRLAGADLKQLRQRVSTIIRLDPFTPEETEAYIDWRMRVAGHAGPSIFAPDAIDLICRVSKGIPRNINSLCFQALSIGLATSSPTIGAQIMREVVADLDPGPRPSYRANAHTQVQASAQAPPPAPRPEPPPSPVQKPAPSFEPSRVGARAVVDRPMLYPAAAPVEANPLFCSWAIAPPLTERSLRGKGLAILACVAVPVLLILAFSNPRLGLSETPPGRISGQVVNAVLSSGDWNSDFAPSLPNRLKPPAAPSVPETNQVANQTPATTAAATNNPEPDAAGPPDSDATSDANEPAARKSSEPDAEPLLEKHPAPASRRTEVVQVTHRENLFEFAFENYGKSSRAIVDDIRGVNPQIGGPYDMLQAGEWVQLPSGTTALTSEAGNR